MLMEIFVIGIIVGFIFGYFSSNWMWTKKVADMLDRALNNKNKESEK